MSVYRVTEIIGTSPTSWEAAAKEALAAAAGGVATALTVLGSAAGARVWVTSRSESKREEALKLGADAAFEAGARLPERVDAVMDTTGAATWSHSIKSLKPGGVLVTAGGAAGTSDGDARFAGVVSTAGR